MGWDKSLGASEFQRKGRRAWGQPPGNQLGRFSHEGEQRNGVGAANEIEEDVAGALAESLPMASW